MSYNQSYKPGDRVLVNSVLPFRHGIVSDWTPEIWKSKGCIGNFTFRKGLIPVYSDRFPETMFWWVHPCQLKIIGSE